MVMHMYRLARSLVTPSLIAAGEARRVDLRDGWKGLETVGGDEMGVGAVGREGYLACAYQDAR